MKKNFNFADHQAQRHKHLMKTLHNVAADKFAERASFVVMKKLQCYKTECLTLRSTHYFPLLICNVAQKLQQNFLSDAEPLIHYLYKKCTFHVKHATTTTKQVSDSTFLNSWRELIKTWLVNK